MLQRVELDGIKLPRLYIAENMQDANLAKSKGIPYIRWTQGIDQLIRQLLRPVLEKMFPDIMWGKILGRRKKFRSQIEMWNSVDEHEEDEVGLLDTHGDITSDDWKPSISDDEYVQDIVTDEDGVITEIADSSSSERLFSGGTGEMTICHKLDIEDYIGDMSSYVNIEVLQKLQLMPAFIGDILDCVKLNVTSGIRWSEGYNKRRDLCIGRFNASTQLPNLVILDVSASIPRGISATMISLIDTLRTQLSADLIITSTNSRFYPMGAELPDPQRIRDMFGYGNEQYEFFKILTNNIRGRHYGHVISFGDYDTPDYKDAPIGMLEGTRVEHVYHYHTGTWGLEKNKKTGYAKWCHLLSEQPKEDYDESWCKIMRRN